MNKLNNKLLELFNVNSYQELKEFIANNPDDERVAALLELIDEINRNENK